MSLGGFPDHARARKRHSQNHDDASRNLLEASRITLECAWPASKEVFVLQALAVDLSAVNRHIKDFQL
jgi:hypothetical protein